MNTLSTMLPMDTFLPFAMQLAVKATILLALATLITIAVRRRSAALRHLVWSLAIGGIVLLPLAMAGTPPLQVLPAANAAPMQEARIPSPEHEETPVTSGTDARPSQENSTSLFVPATNDAPAVGATDVSLFGARSLIMLWALGALTLLARFFAGLIRLRAVVGRARPVTAREWLGAPLRDASEESAVLRVSDEVDMPFASGLVRPTIVLPAASADWDSQRRVAVLQHELAHLSRGDLLMNALSQFARALYWFNPLAWYAAHRLRIEAERACDDAVLRQGARASDYAEHLLSIAGGGAVGVPAAALAMARPSAFEGRLLAILEPGLERSALSRLKVAAAMLLLVAVILPLAAAAPAGQAAALPPSMSAPESWVETPATMKPIGQQPPASAVSETAQPRQPREEQAAQGSSTAVPALIEALSDSNAAVRLAAVNSLGQLEDPRAIAALGKALREDSDARVRKAAAEALGQIDDTRAVPHLLAALRDERVSDVRAAIVEALGEIDDPSAIGGIAAVVRDSSVAVRRAAASALSDFDDPSVLPAILSMVRDSDTEVRRYVADALGDLESPRALEALTLLARDADAEVRAAAIDGLGNLEDRRTLPVLLAALADSNADVRGQAADAIHNIPDLGKAPPQLIALLTDPDHDVRHNVAHALGGIGDEAAVPALRRALGDTNPDVRRAVAEALSEIGGADAITALLALLKDPDPEIRRTAAEALGKRHE